MFEFGLNDLALLVPFIVIGFAAQAVDGALGMAFGVITNTMLVGLMGVPPAQASARVHVAECFTTAASGLSHLYHGNIDFRLFSKLVIPGVIGGVGGVFLISNIDGDIIKPFVLAYLAFIGIWLLVRGLFYPPKIKKARFVSPLGLVGGFLDAVGGGGWGPVVTSNLLFQGGDPRKVIGTVNSAEFFLTVAISSAFIFNLGITDLLGPTLGLLIGGVLAAPFGAMIAKYLKPRIILIMVGVVLIVTSCVAIASQIWS